ncbi:MAG: hypothetical protein S4CHLAM45_10600 [Chlamydiales bacterium]|nr:hypothetical protein [Chlamydiales bacterium]MCH9619553.1 hypothetical protein [Chlamydiales bacterium]MCH9623159.1 hypothetical protein [Chlamydiales bacterium]
MTATQKCSDLCNFADPDHTIISLEEQREAFTAGEMLIVTWGGHHLKLVYPNPSNCQWDAPNRYWRDVCNEISQLEAAGGTGPKLRRRNSKSKLDPEVCQDLTRVARYVKNVDRDRFLMKCCLLVTTVMMLCTIYLLRRESSCERGLSFTPK